MILDREIHVPQERGVRNQLEKCMKNSSVNVLDSYVVILCCVLFSVSLDVTKIKKANFVRNLL